MAKPIDEATIIAWVDGELDELAAARIAKAVETDPQAAALAERHRAMKARFASAFGPIAEEPVALPEHEPAQVISLAAVRAEREAQAAPPVRRNWMMTGAIAASLIVGLLTGQRVSQPNGLIDQPDALALSRPLAVALDNQLSGDKGVVRVALTFRDRDGHYCRSFAGRNLSGIACRDEGRWRLRYGSATGGQATDYRMAGADPGQAQLITTMMAGDPLDRPGEEAARLKGWR